MRTLLPLLILVCLSTFTGCQGVPDSELHPGLVKFKLGDLRCNVRATPRQVITALERALMDDGVAIRETRVDDIEGALLARTAMDRRIEAEVRRQTPTITWLRLRVGPFGDKDLSRAFHAGMMAHLKESERQE